MQKTRLLERSKSKLSLLKAGFSTGAWVAVFLTALLLRVYKLSLKPIHFDEGVNGWFVGHMWNIGHYQYNPENFHGPLYFYLLQLFEVLFGMGLESLRLTSVLAALGTLYLFYRMRPLIGERILIAAIVIALSPAFVFYSRTAIHEMTFVFFQCLSVYGFFRWRFHGHRLGVSLLTAGATGCLLIKETSIVFFIVFVIAWFLAKYYPVWLGRFFQNSPRNLLNEESPYLLKPKETFYYLVSSVCFLILFYSAFFRHPDGVSDFFQSLAPWMKVGMDSGHNKPWFYYLQLLLRYEPLILLSLVGIFYALVKSDLKMRFFALLGLGQFLAYSIIPYKTPWLVLSFLWPFAIYGSFLLSELLKVAFSVGAIGATARLKTVARVFVALLAMILIGDGVQTLHLNFKNYTNPKEPYVYVQTKKQFSWMTGYFKKLGELEPHLKSTKVRVLAEDIWPLPFIFRSWTNVGLYGVEGFSRRDVAPIMIVEKKDLADMARQLEKPYWAHIIDVRDGREKVVLLIEDEPRFLPLPESKGWRLVGRKVREQ